MAASFNVRGPSRAARTSYFLLPTPYFLLPTSYFLLPTSYLLPPTSYLLLATSYLLLPTSYFLLPTSYFLLVQVRGPSRAARRQLKAACLAEAGEGSCLFVRPNRWGQWDPKDRILLPTSYFLLPTSYFLLVQVGSYGTRRTARSPPTSLCGVSASSSSSAASSSSVLLLSRRSRLLLLRCVLLCLFRYGELLLCPSSHLPSSSSAMLWIRYSNATFCLQPPGDAISRKGKR